MEQSKFHSLNNETNQILCDICSLACSVMIGRQGGVGRELSTLLDRDLVITHCAAHRLELVVKKSFKQSVPEQDKFTLDVNSFGVFYGAMNTKKWQHLIGKFHGIMYMDGMCLYLKLSIFFFFQNRI